MALELSPAAVRRLGANALRDVFERLDSESFGQHQMSRVGIGHEPSGETKPLEFGDPFRLDLQRTLRNALRRQAAAGGAGSRIGVPLRLTADDFEIDRTEQLVRSSTVLALDLSMSMPMEGRFVPAKVAMALRADRRSSPTTTSTWWCSPKPPGGSDRPNCRRRAGTMSMAPTCSMR